MKLVPLEASDLDLYMRLFTDPVYMADLGGPQPAEKVPLIFEKQRSCHDSGDSIVLKIIPEETDWLLDEEHKRKSGATEFYEYRNDSEWQNGIGTLCLWKYGGEHTEIGYGILPKYQNHGFTTTAVRMLLDMARQEKEKWGLVHINTSVNNRSSNRLCEKLNLRFVEIRDIDYDDRIIQANHYTIDLLAP
jgi:RimJ/RimL family protein N-acetyltransferase